MALSKANRRYDMLFDPMKLSEALGYNLHEVDHGAELLASVGPRILPQSDKLSSEAVSFSELPGHKSRLVLWPRGHYKTTAVELYIVNLILAYPDIRILLMQSTARNTRGLLRNIKSHFNGENPKSAVPEVFPRWVNTDKRTGDPVRLGTADGFICPARTRNLKEWTVSVAGSKTSKTGQHYDVMFFDDLVTPENFRNQELQEKLIEDFAHLTPLLEPGGFKTVTGTRYSFGDLYGWIIRNDAERREWDISVRTCWKDGQQANGPLFPEKKTADGARTLGFTTEVLLAIKADNPATFSCQYLNQPIAAGTQLFTQELLMRAVKRVEPRDIPAIGAAILFVDLGSSKNTNDHCVCICTRQDSFHRVYVTDIKSGNFSPMQFATVILEMLLQHRPVLVKIEGTAAGKYFIEYLRNIASTKGMIAPAEELKVSNTKDAKHLRISCIEGVLKTGKLFFLPGLPDWEDLVEQFTTYPRGRHDDEIDTVSLAVQFYTQNNVFYRPPAIQGLAQHLLSNPELPAYVEQPTDHADAEESCGADFC